MREVKINKIENTDMYLCGYTRWINPGQRCADYIDYQAIFDKDLNIKELKSKRHFSSWEIEDLTKIVIAEKKIITYMRKQLSLQLGITQKEDKPKDWKDAIIAEYHSEPELVKACKVSDKKVRIKYSWGEIDKKISAVNLKWIGEEGLRKWKQYLVLLEEADKVFQSIVNEG